ncbi:MAG: C45 family autoproteolytic acyltransferase/hydrolase [Pseudomonadota bacterium]
MPIETMSEHDVGPADAAQRSRLRWHREAGTGKRFFVLRQKGAFAEICEDHGRALAKDIETGVFPEIIDTIRVDTDSSSDFLDRIFRALFSRIAEDVFTSTSGEFQDGVRALDRGYAAGHPTRRFDFNDVVNACVSIDAGNIATGFARRGEKYGSPDADLAGLISFVVGSLRRYPGANTDSIVTDPESLFSAIARQAGTASVGMGCTGFSAAPGQTNDGLGLHGRTFDGAFFDWNNTPGLFIIDERDPARPQIKHRYVAVGTAGLIYPGGISGMNDAGLACSIHQMSTTTYALGGSGDYEIAPYVQQRILREASSLDEAIALVRSIKHFASWSILVSDAVAGKSARIEINGHGGSRPGKPEVAVTPIADTAVQTNHFETPDMAEQFDHFGDAHFTKSVGKWLETRSREVTTRKRLDLLIGTRQLDTTEAIQLLAAHDDAELEGSAAGQDASRAFGRTVCKAYGLMASIARADPDRDRANDEIWFTIGDRLPGPHSRFAGFRVDWDTLDLTPVGDDPVRVAQTLEPKADHALSHYVEGFRTLARPRIGGEFLGREPSASELKSLRDTAIGHIGKALDLAEDARGAPDITYRYIRARLRHENGHYDAAQADWQVLTQLADSKMPPVPLNDYERALICVGAAATAKAGGREQDVGALLESGEKWLDRVKDRFSGGAWHPGLSKWQDTVFKLRDRPGYVDLLDIDFVNVE